VFVTFMFGVTVAAPGEAGRMGKRCRENEKP
jgi:hypothetical protein